MSNIFNLANAFKESSIREIPSIASENYMLSAIEDLEKANHAINERTKDLYDCISEAESKDEENEIFASYFEDISSRVGKIIKSINETTARFIINIDNIADANRDILENSSILTDCNDFQFSKYTFKNINNPEFPKMDPVKNYKKEFDIIGQMLQELGPAATNQAKLKVIATVYNSLSSTMKNDWVRKCVDDMLGATITDDTNFADALFSHFRDKDPVETTIDKGTLYKIKVAMEDRQALISSISETSDKLIADLQYILDDFCMMVTGTKLNKIIVDTKTDGIRNTSYKADDYTSNQLCIFLKAKIDQIVRMCNLYYIALSIKLDATVDYFNQCKEILSVASMNCDSQTETTDSSDDSESDDEYPELDSDNESDDEDDDDDKDEDEDDKDDDDEDDEDEDDDEDRDDEDDKDGDEDKIDTTATNENCQRILDEIRSFNYQIFELGMVYEHYDLIDHVSSLITEADDNGNSGTDNTNNDDKKPGFVQKTVQKIWKVIINKLAELFNKFKDNVLQLINGNDQKKKIEFIKKNEKLIDKQVKSHKNEDGSIVAPKINFSALDTLAIPDVLNDVSKMKTVYTDASAFIAKDPTLSKFKPTKDGESIADIIKGKVLDYDNGYKDTAEMESVKKDYKEFVLNGLSKYTDVVSAMTKKIESAEKTVDSLSAKNESAMLGDASEYFAEFSAQGSDNSSVDGGTKKDDPNVDNLAKVYFKVCADVVSASMSVIMTVFNECYSFLAWHIKTQQEALESGNADNSNSNKSEKTSSSSSKFNN